MRFQIYLFFLISISAIACGGNKKVDVSGIDVNININRFDRALDSVAENNLALKLPQLEKRYTYFFSDFMTEMLAVGNVRDTAYYVSLREVFADPDYRQLQSEVARVYPDLKKQEQELTELFRHIRYYYPQNKVPEFIAFFSGFSNQIVIGNGYVGIGLDMFLGRDSKFYPSLRESLPAYITRRFTPENITPRVAEAYIREELYPENESDVSLLSRMIYNGKVLYMMDRLMPDMEDSLKIGYSSDQIKWAKMYEADIWAYFMEQNLLFETDFINIQKYLNEAPFTPGLGEKNESAPKLALFTGWQIIKAYMDRNPEVSLQELIADTDSQKILKLSKYKP